MKSSSILIFILLSFSLNKTFAQEKVKLVKANSPKVAIKDGWEGKTKYWNHLIKSQLPIVYHLAKNCKKRKVTFYTDVDSISMNVEGESNYQFKVLLNKSDTCTVILTTKNHKYERLNNNQNETDTLPFTLNKNKQIIIKGSINNSPKMNFVFDLGARVAYVIGKNYDKLNNLTLDGIMEDESVTGLSSEKTSSNNSLQLGNLNISNMPICYIDEAGFLENGGALIGYNVFQNKILEIDFDNKLLLIHNKLPEKINTYSQTEFKQTTGGLYVPITIYNGKKISKGWYFFDTGADNALTFDSRFAKREDLYNTMKIIGKAGIASSENRVVGAEILEVPEVTLASYKLEDVPTLLANESNAESEFEDGVIGIGLQSKFNFIIDYSNSKMYLKPSKYFNDSFKKKDEITTNLIIGLSLALGLLLVVFFAYKKSKTNINYFRINMLFFSIFTLICNSCSTLKNMTYPITNGNLISRKISNKHSFTYKELKEYEGLYEYINSTTLKIAASPIDTTLLCIINESRYPFTTISKNIFLNSVKDSVIFLRNSVNKVIGYKSGKDTFNLLPQKVSFPKKMWYPRLNIPKNHTYSYQQPKNDNDGLKTGNLDNTGLDKELLSEMVQKIIDGTYPNVHSVLIIKDGKLVFEEYFYEHHKNKLHELRSATKSFISALTGIAIKKGYIKSKNEKVLPYFPEYTFKNNLDLKNEITIENLLTNQSGLDCDVYNPKAVGNESQMAYENDWIQYSLDLPMVDRPGGIGQYCSSNPIIMGRIIEKATKMTLPEFAKQTLFKDIGIKSFDWNFKPDPSSGETFCQVNLRSRDMAKFGLLYLNNGLWNEKQVIPKEWVEQSFDKHSVVAGLDYGYLWWTKYLDANGVRYYGKLAQGNGGQKIYIFKELNLVTVITAGHYNMQSSSNELNAKYILPAFNKK